MNRYDARQQFTDGLERYIFGIETDAGLFRLCENVRVYDDRLPGDACELVRAITANQDGFSGTYRDAAEAVRAELARNN